MEEQTEATTEETTVTTYLESVASGPAWVCVPTEHGHVVVQAADVRCVIDGHDGKTHMRVRDGAGSGGDAVFTVIARAAEVYALLRGGA